MRDKGLAAYIAELLGTFLLVFFVCSVVIQYVSAGNQAQFGSDFAVVGLVHAFLLFGLLILFGGVSGGHFNPVVTVAIAALRRIDPLDAAVYILAQLTGGVLGALLARGLLVDEGRAVDYGAAKISPALGSAFQGALVEAIGAFVLVLVICAAALGARSVKEWAPLVIGTTLGLLVMVLAPLTGGSFNPARWFGPALAGDSFGSFRDIWPYLAGPLVGALLAAGVFRFVIEAGELEEPDTAPGKSDPAKPATPR